MRRLMLSLLYRIATWAWWLLLAALIVGSWAWDDIRGIVDAEKGERHD